MVKQSEFNCVGFFYLFFFWGGGSYGVNKLIVTKFEPQILTFMPYILIITKLSVICSYFFLIENCSGLIVCFIVQVQTPTVQLLNHWITGVLFWFWGELFVQTRLSHASFYM